MRSIQVATEPLPEDLARVILPARHAVADSRRLMVYYKRDGAGRLLMARDGLIRGNVAQWRDYLSPDFHPSQAAASRSQQWLQANAAQYAVVGAAA